MTIVTLRQFEEEVERVRADVRNPAHGVFGPDSVTWRVSRDAFVFLGAGRAALLQLAHPYVAHAIEQHSETRTDPIGRFNRTFLNVFGMIFGDLDSALASARRVRSVHDRVNGPIDEDVGRYTRGHAYHAHDAGALLWVFATLVDTSVMAFEMGFGPLSSMDREAYYRELCQFARLFGLPGELLPKDWSAFQAYIARMVASDELGVGRPAREVGTFLLSAPSAPMVPVMRWYTTLTAGMLPPRIREQYALAFTRTDAIVYRASVSALRATWKHLPERLRLRPEYVEARRRLAGRPRPDRVGRALEHALLRAVRPRDATSFRAGSSARSPSPDRG
jgi:uncharacterized protein (DUF2236 family)